MMNMTVDRLSDARDEQWMIVWAIIDDADVAWRGVAWVWPACREGWSTPWTPPCVLPRARPARYTADTPRARCSSLWWRTRSRPWSSFRRTYTSSASWWSSEEGTFVQDLWWWRILTTVFHCEKTICYCINMTGFGVSPLLSFIRFKSWLGISVNCVEPHPFFSDITDSRCGLGPSETFCNL